MKKRVSAWIIVCLMILSGGGCGAGEMSRIPDAEPWNAEQMDTVPVDAEAIPNMNSNHGGETEKSNPEESKSTEDIHDDAYTAGHSADYDEGYAAGQSVGYSAGYEDGAGIGYDSGYAAGQTAGYDEGYAAGQSVGYSTGYQDGAGVGYDNGYAAGQTAGYDEGYAAGRSVGYSEGTVSGYGQGYETGYKEGGDAGYDSGYSAGVKAADPSSTSGSSSLERTTENAGEDLLNTYHTPSQQQTADIYVLNKNTMKIHLPSCSSVKRISPANYATSNSSLSELESQGYTRCKICLK